MSDKSVTPSTECINLPDVQVVEINPLVSPSGGSYILLANIRLPDQLECKGMLSDGWMYGVLLPSDINSSLSSANPLIIYYSRKYTSHSALVCDALWRSLYPNYSYDEWIGLSQEYFGDIYLCSQIAEDFLAEHSDAHDETIKNREVIMGLNSMEYRYIECEHGVFIGGDFWAENSSSFPAVSLYFKAEDVEVIADLNSGQQIVMASIIGKIKDQLEANFPQTGIINVHFNGEFLGPILIH